MKLQVRIIYAALVSALGLWVTVAVAFILANAAKVSDKGQYGDYPTAWTIGGVAGTVIVAIGLIGWGIWLRNEEPVDIGSSSESTAITT